MKKKKQKASVSYPPKEENTSILMKIVFSIKRNIKTFIAIVSAIATLIGVLPNISSVYELFARTPSLQISTGEYFLGLVYPRITETEDSLYEKQIDDFFLRKSTDQFFRSFIPSIVWVDVKNTSKLPISITDVKLSFDDSLSQYYVSIAPEKAPNHIFIPTHYAKKVKFP